MKRRHWYHCTSKNHGPVFQPVRRPPVSRGLKEPVTPRLCVASTVARCFTAVLFNRGPVYVYKTEKPRRAIKAVGVWDAPVTMERWLIPPVTLVLDRVIPESTVEEALCAVRMYHQETRKNSDLILKILQLAIAGRVFGNNEIDQRICANLLTKWGISDPEDYILGLIEKAKKPWESVFETIS